MNGFFVVCELSVKKAFGNAGLFFDNITRSPMTRIAGVLIVFSMICFTWIFFRAETLSDACYIVSHLFVFKGFSGLNGIFLGQPPEEFMLFLPVLFLIGLINFMVDPANLFDNSRRYEKGIAKILSEGRNVANIGNFDERLLQRFYADSLRSAPDLVVFGSSRVLGLNSSMLECESFFNSAVSGASFEDIAAIYQIYRERRMLPSNIILGIDPWLLNKNNNQTRWRSISEEYERIKPMLYDNSVKSKCPDYGYIKYTEILSPGYFKQSVKVLLKNFLSRKGVSKDYYSISDATSNSAVKMSDGSLSYDKSLRARSPEEVGISVEAVVAQKPIYSLGDYDALDEHMRTGFENFLDLAVSDGVSLTILAVPCHPRVYAEFKRDPDYRMVLESELYFHNLCSSRNIPMIGSFDPGYFGFDNDSFYDFMHLKPEAFGIICLELNKVVRRDI